MSEKRTVGRKCSDCDGYLDDCFGDPEVCPWYNSVEKEQELTPIEQVIWAMAFTRDLFNWDVSPLDCRIRAAGMAHRAVMQFRKLPGDIFPEKDRKVVEMFSTLFKRKYK